MKSLYCSRFPKIGGTRHLGLCKAFSLQFMAPTWESGPPISHQVSLNVATAVAMEAQKLGLAGRHLGRLAGHCGAAVVLQWLDRGRDEKG